MEASKHNLPNLKNRSWIFNTKDYGHEEKIKNDVLDRMYVDTTFRHICIFLRSSKRSVRFIKGNTTEILSCKTKQTGSS